MTKVVTTCWLKWLIFFYWTKNYEKNIEMDMIYCSDAMRDNNPMIDKVLGWENKKHRVTPSRGVVMNMAPLDFFKG